MEHTYIDLIIGIGWILFILYWFTSAVASKKSIGDFGFSIKYRLVIVIIAIVIIHISNKDINQVGYAALAPHNLVIAVVGVCLFIAGLSYAIWARIYLGRNWGMPMTRKEEPELVTSGPYAYARHPIYTGMLLGMLGTSLAVSLYWLVFFCLNTVYFMYSAKHEEGYLRQQFPKQYPAYMKRTKMLLPFIF